MASHPEESTSLLRFPNRQLSSRECCARNALTPTTAGVPYCGITILPASRGFTTRKVGHRVHDLTRLSTTEEKFAFDTILLHHVWMF